jgi:hypothetical protein
MNSKSIEQESQKRNIALLRAFLDQIKTLVVNLIPMAIKKMPQMEHSSNINATMNCVPVQVFTGMGIPTN